MLGVETGDEAGGSVFVFAGLADVFVIDIFIVRIRKGGVFGIERAGVRDVV